jgi:hypothetical protein
VRRYQLQGNCKLLGDARDAKALSPSAQIQIARLEQEKVSVSEQLKDEEICLVFARNIVSYFNALQQTLIP